MASSEVDQKFLGKLAKSAEQDNPLLATMLYKILGLSINLSQQLVQAQRIRRRQPPHSSDTINLFLHVIWLSREGLVMLEQYVLPVVGKYVELKVLAYKLRASFYHIFVLFYNQPPISTIGFTAPDKQGASSTENTPPNVDKGKGIAREEDVESTRSSLQPTHPLEGGPVHPPPGFGPEPHAAFLLPTADYLPLASRYFRDAVDLAEGLLWGSHSLRLSVKTEYAAFLYECAHDVEGSRKVAKDTITEVYEATEGIDNDMFADACELVTVLGKMMKRGLSTSSRSHSARGGSSRSAGQGQSQRQQGQNPISLQPSQAAKQPPSRKSAPRTGKPPPMPATSAAALHAMHAENMPEFI